MIVFVWIVMSHGHIIRGIWTTEQAAQEHASSLPQHPDINAEIIKVRTDARL